MSGTICLVQYVWYTMSGTLCLVQYVRYNMSGPISLVEYVWYNMSCTMCSMSDKKALGFGFDFAKLCLSWQVSVLCYISIWDCLYTTRFNCNFRKQYPLWQNTLWRCLLVWSCACTFGGPGLISAGSVCNDRWACDVVRWWGIAFARSGSGSMCPGCCQNNDIWVCCTVRWLLIAFGH